MVLAQSLGALRQRLTCESSLVNHLLYTHYLQYRKPLNKPKDIKTPATTGGFSISFSL